MEKRELGKSGIAIAPLAFGGNVFGWTADESSSFALLDAFLAEGFNFIDTADVYSAWAPGNKGGESETILGKWLQRRRKRDDVIVATKAGKPMGPGKKGLSRTYLREAIEDSLKRLQTDYIDLYQSHEDDASVPLEETLAAFDELIKEGKVRAIGASNYSAERLAAALNVSEQHGLTRYECLQPLYSLAEREAYEAALEPVCVKNGLGVISYFSVASGFLSGKYRSEADASKAARGPMVKKYFNERGYRILSALEEVAKKHRSTSARVALAWLMARPSITAPIASATNVGQLKDLVEATKLSLDQESIEALNAASR